MKVPQIIARTAKFTIGDTRSQYQRWLSASFLLESSPRKIWAPLSDPRRLATLTKCPLALVFASPNHLDSSLYIKPHSSLIHSSPEFNSQASSICPRPDVFGLEAAENPAVGHSHGELLELYDSSADCLLEDCSLKICFPGSAIINCQGFEFRNYIDFLVCTSNGVARFTFNCTRSSQVSKTHCSIFSNDPEFHYFYQVKGLQPSLIKTATSYMCRSRGDALFVYGLSSGSILAARTAFGVAENVEVFELHQTSMIQKLWSGITPFTKSETDSSVSVLDMTLVGFKFGEELVATICKDHRLRLWDLKHRSCSIVLDFLDTLPDSDDHASGPKSLHSAFVPGLYHRIACYPMDASGSSVGLVVYLSLSHTSNLEPSPKYLTSVGACRSLNYWCWMNLNVRKALQRERDCIKIVAIEPVTHSQFDVEERDRFTSREYAETNVLDFLPVHFDNPPFWLEENDPCKGEKKTSFCSFSGVWWISHQTNSREANLEDRYSICWSLMSSHCNPGTLYMQAAALPPGCTPDDPLPSWRQEPPLLRIGTDNSGHADDSVNSPSVENVDAFLDFIFHPSRLSWFAIVNALKSLRESHQLPSRDFLPADNMDELRSQVRATLLEELVARSRLLLQHLRRHNRWTQWKSAMYGVEEFTCQEFDVGIDPNKLVACILGELDETFCSLEPLPFADPTDWKRLVFSSVSSSKTNVLIAFGKLTDLLEKSEETVNFEGDSFMNDEQTWSSVSKVPTLAVGLVSQSFIQTCETRLKFAFSLLMLASRYHLNPINTEEFSMYEDSNTCENIIARLSRLVRSLRLLLWIGSTRVHSVTDPKKLTIVEDHLSILGLRYSSQVGRPSIEPDQPLQSFSQLPGLTLLEQLCSNWPDCQFCRTINSVDSNAVQQPWMLRCSTLVADLYTTLNSSQNYGRGLLRVFRHLLLGGHAKELITLANLLSVANPPGLSSRADDVDQDFTELYSAETPSWDGDYSLVRLLTGLAHLWVDQPDLAEEDFIQASDWLKCHIQGILQSRSDLGCLPIAIASPTTFSQTLLLGVLFPGEFSDLQLFCSEESHECISDHICPEEVQVRFLMKVMPVLEASDCVVQVLRLCEFALNILAKVHLAPPCTDDLSSSMNNPSSDQHTIKSGRLTSILNNLHAGQGEPNEGFLCGPIPKNEPLTGQTAQSLLYSRLSDLEAALWTRMFKHHLALGHYTSAHLLIRSNPDVDRRRDCLRQLIVTLCDRGESSRLVSFHYGASEDEFLLILEARARATDVLPSVVPISSTVDSASSVNPYYDVLYAFHIRHANYRAAAMILFEHAHRLAEETACSMFSVCSNGFRAGGARLLFGLQRQAACLVAAINALYLVPKEHQWLIRPGSSSAQDAYPSSWIPLGSNRKNDGLSDTELDLDELVEDDWAFADTGDQASSEPVRSSNNAKCQPNTDTTWHNNAVLSGSVVKNVPDSQPPTRMALDKQILQLSDLLRLYTLTRARLRLAQVCWEQGMLRAGPVSPVETVHSLLSLALYDEAVKVSEQFALNFTPIVDAVASRCAELAQHTAVHPSSTGPQRSTQSGFSQVPSLPGLVTVSAPLSHETDLVTQSLQALAGSAGIHTTSEEVLSGARSQPLGELYWRLLEVILNRLDPAIRSVIFQSAFPRQHMTNDGGYLHLLACQRLLQSGPNRLHLPEWLVSRLLCTSARTCRPAGLLRLYLQQDRIVPAYDLVMDMLDAATGVTGADPSAFGLLLSVGHLSPLIAMSRADDPRLGQILVNRAQFDKQSLPVTRPTIGLIQVPCDEGVRRNGGRLGASDGPAAVMNLLPRFGCLDNREWNIDLRASGIQLVAYGETGSTNLEDVHVDLKNLVRDCLRSGVFPFSIGGGNDQSSANGSAWIEHLRSQRSSDDAESKLTVINVDAHLDVRPLMPDFDGQLLAHSGSPFRQLVEMTRDREASGE
ncbi:nuclear pore complex protein Nup160 [Paragonimus westermani]|uniref:Nuclear pore complex protein Nup160 n=1 Tax=Paragonimus westermani TaxID=34504 RepID=A0A5J4P066_9TREM|nr:nuclear pore complex protein Nup160 [Paragonimus westermani]